MYNYNKIQQKQIDNEKKTNMIPYTVIVMCILTIGFLSVSDSSNVYATTESLGLVTNSTQNQSSTSAAPGDFGIQPPVSKVADPDAYTYEVNYKQNMDLNENTQVFEVTVKESGFDNLGVEGIPTAAHVYYPDRTYDFIKGDNTDTSGVAHLRIPIEKAGSYRALIVTPINSETNPLKEWFLWTVTDSNENETSGSSSYKFEVTLGSNEVDIEDNPLQRIITAVTDDDTGDPISEIKLTVKVTDPSGSFKEYPRITDSDGEDRLTVPVEEVGEYTAEIDVKDPSTGKVAFTDTVTWSAK